MNKLSDLTLTSGPPHPIDASIRTFTLWEMTEYLFSISLSHLRRLLRSEEGLPTGHSKTDGATREFTAEELRKIGQRLGLPFLKRQVCIGIIGQNAEKTAQISALLAIRGALAGYDITALDLGANGGLTKRCGKQLPQKTAAGEHVLAQSAMAAHRAINQRRAGLGEPPLALPLGLTSEVETPISMVPTAWPGLKLLPGGQTGGHGLDWALWQRMIPQWTGRDALSRLTIPAGDLVICDMGADPTPLMLAGLDMTDLLVVIDDGTSADWFACLSARIALQDQATSETATALGTTVRPFSWAKVLRLPLEGATAFGPNTLPGLPASALPDQRTVWDIIPRSMPRARYVQLRAAPEALWQAVEAHVQQISQFDP